MDHFTKIFFILAFSFVSLCTKAQEDIVSYTKNSGLPSSSIYATLVDSKGVVWLGTGNGVCAFSGGKLTSIKNIAGRDGYSKSIGRVNIIYEAPNGEIWIASEKGLFVYSGKYWTYFKDNENDDFVIKELFADINGKVWVIYEKFNTLNDMGNFGFSLVEGIVQMYNGYNWLKFTGEIGGSSAVPVGDATIYFTSHIEDHDGNMWLTNRDGLYKFTGDSWTEYNEEQLPSDICNQVFQSQNGNIWVGTKYGISRWDENEWTGYDEVKSIKHQSVLSINEDSEGRIWIVTTKDDSFKKICYFEDEKWKCFKKDKIKIRGSFKELLVNEKNIIAISQKSISSYRENSWHQFSSIIPGETFYQIVENKEYDKIIVSGKYGVYELSDDKLNQIYSYQEGWLPTFVFVYKNDVWVGTDKSGAFKINHDKVDNYSTSEGLLDNQIKEIFSDKESNIWIVTKTGISKITKQ